MGIDWQFKQDYASAEKNEKYYEQGGVFTEKNDTDADGNLIKRWSGSVFNAIPTSDNNGGIYLIRHYNTNYDKYPLRYPNKYYYKVHFYGWKGTYTFDTQTYNPSSNSNFSNITTNTKTLNLQIPTEYETSFGQMQSNFGNDKNGQAIPWTFSTNLPIFDENDTESINKYKNDGDTGGAINKDYLDIDKVYTRVYVDNSQPPNLKFTWNIENGEPPTNYTIEIFDVTQYGEIPIKTIISKGSYSTTWGLLESIVQSQGSQQSYSLKCYFSYNNGTDKIGVQINRDGSYSPSSAHIGKHYLTTHRGTGESDDGYQETEDESSATDENVTVNICDLLTNTYKVTDAQLKSVGNFLWASDFFDNIKLVNNNPIENVISCKALPINVDGTSTTISMGNVNSGVGGVAVSTNYLKKEIGSIYVPRIYNNFVDFEHCQVTLYLPLIGIITDLSPSEVVGYTITLKYCFDLITGDCLAMIFNNRGGGENCIGTYKGNCGVDIPLTASNRAQVQAGYISDFVGGIASIATKDIGGVINSGLGALTRQYTNRSSGAVSGVTAQGLPKKAYLTLVENATQIPSNYAQTYGRPCNLTKKLKDLSGFTVCDNNIRVSNIVCTEEEQEEIRDLLTKGVIL